MRKLSLAFSSVLMATAALLAPAQSYKVTGSIAIGGTGGWDYLTADAQNRRLYVSHGNEVVVIDPDSQKIVGHITGLNRIHGIAIASDLGLGFISDGGSNEVVAFQLEDLSVKQKIKAGTNPDGIVYDSASKRVFAFNGRSGDATAIDGATGNVAGTVKLGGKPEFPVSDGQGSVYANIEDKSEIVRIDSKALTVSSRWSVAPCESPSGLAIDGENRRLFSVCDNKMMAIVDADTGKVIATPAIGEGPDAAAFDPGTKLAFSSNGESGTLTVIKESGKDQYSEAGTVQTAQGARTMALDEKTHKIYLATASFGPPAPSTSGNARRRPTILPGTFKLLVVSEQ
ncbi:MAG: YncE family protein [Acidobacteriaceae bacterium]|nr:YncE family protein [Acidobacteriaceae bacterium]